MKSHLHRAAELGTRKVITDHSTIGLVITADGSFGEIKRPSYMEAEEKTVRELKALGKPFLILLNSMRPYSDETKVLAGQMEEKYGVQVMPGKLRAAEKGGYPAHYGNRADRVSGSRNGFLYS